MSIQPLRHRKAALADLPAVLKLLVEDELGKTREGAEISPRYIDAFHKINEDPKQYLMVATMGEEIVGTCHLTIMPSLTFEGATRMQIEAVRVSEKHRGQKIGHWMMQMALGYAKANSVSIVQLTTNKQRARAQHFYESLGFQASHEGMKLYVSDKTAS